MTTLEFSNYGIKVLLVVNENEVIKKNENNIHFDFTALNGKRKTKKEKARFRKM